MIAARLSVSRAAPYHVVAVLGGWSVQPVNPESPPTVHVTVDSSDVPEPSADLLKKIDDGFHPKAAIPDLMSSVAKHEGSYSLESAAADLIKKVINKGKTATEVLLSADGTVNFGPNDLHTDAFLKSALKTAPWKGTWTQKANGIAKMVENILGLTSNDVSVEYDIVHKWFSIDGKAQHQVFGLKIVVEKLETASPLDVYNMLYSELEPFVPSGKHSILGIDLAKVEKLEPYVQILPAEAFTPMEVHFVSSESPDPEFMKEHALAFKPGFSVIKAEPTKKK